MRLARSVAVFFSLFLAFLTVSAHPAFSQNPTLTIATDEEKEGGYLVEITKAAFQKVGYGVQLNFIPWARALNGTIEGQYDMLLGAYYSAERAKKMAYSEQIGSVEVYLWKRKDSNISYEKLDDLKSFSVGLVRNSTVSEDFDKAIPSLKVEYANNGEINLKKLLAGNLDLFVEKKQQVDFLLRTTYKDSQQKVEPLGTPLKSGKFFNAFSMARPDHQKVLADFNRGLQIIREDGTERSILEKYGMAS